MRRNRKNNSPPLEINLVPMMDVLMTILTFFIIISMTLTGQQSITVSLPSAKPDKMTDTKDPDPMVVGLNTQGQILVQDKPITDFQLSQQISDYLGKNPKGAVLLKADKKVSYEQVAKVLGTMRDVGGDRVSLAIEG
jgi:biopolymer transport protein ExbD